MAVVCDRGNEALGNNFHTISVQKADGEIRILHVCDEHLLEYETVVNAWLEG